MDANYAKLKHPPLKVALLDTLDSATLDFLHATVTQDDQELKKRIIDATAEAYATFPFPSIRKFHHVRLAMYDHPVYSKVLTAGKSGQTLFLEIGCCMGSEVRKLAYDGYTAANILGVDIVPEYIEAGFTLYRDRDTTPIHLITADAFSVPLGPRSTPPAAPFQEIKDLTSLVGTLTHIGVIRVFNIFNQERQTELARRLVALLKHEPGAIVFGKHAGAAEPKLLDDPPEWKLNRWAHSPASFEKLWKSVFAEVEGEEWAETRVKVSAELKETPDLEGGATHYMVWSVEII